MSRMFQNQSKTKKPFPLTVGKALCVSSKIQAQTDLPTDGCRRIMEISRIIMKFVIIVSLLEFCRKVKAINAKMQKNIVKKGRKRAK